jgi:hypothetical protein
MTDKRVLTLKNIPYTYTTTKWMEIRLASPAKFNQLAIGVADASVADGGSFFLYKDTGAIIDRVLDDDTYTTKDIFGINFVEYFSKIFDKDVSHKGIKSKLLYIYNVGDELSNSTAYADKVLASLIKTNNSAGNTTIINSDRYGIALFKRNYPISAELIETFNEVQR